MLRRTAWIALLSLTGSAHGGSVLEATQYAAEIPLAALALPGADTGFVELAVCDRCTPRRLRLASDAIYIINGRSVTRAELAAALEGAHTTSRAAHGGIAAVLVDASSRNVASVLLSVPGRSVVPPTNAPRTALR